MIKLQRVYKVPRAEGYRILVDRLWPRGLSKEKVKADLWLKEITPSNDLRKWSGHDIRNWPEFRERYFRELDGKSELVDKIIEKSRTLDVILLYGGQDESHNNAAALKEYIKIKMKNGKY
jgi:uncharacterized protein YeaO (DUF488 family)